MKFLVDAQLPRRTTRWLEDVGHDALHTLDLPSGNRTTDAEITEICVREKRVLITKDTDFSNSFLVSARPPKLLLISTGNISNNELEAVFTPAIPRIVEALRTHDFVELSRQALITHA